MVCYISSLGTSPAGMGMGGWLLCHGRDAVLLFFSPGPVKTFAWHARADAGTLHPMPTLQYVARADPATGGMGFSHLLKNKS